MAAEVLHDDDPNEKSPSIHEMVESFRARNCAVYIRSAALGGEVIALVPTPELDAEARRKGVVTYSPTELEVLLGTEGLDGQSLALIHQAKKLFRGRICRS